VERIVMQYKQQILMQVFEQLLTSMTERCYDKCVGSSGKFGNSLSKSDKNCLIKCQDRFMESYNLANSTHRGRMFELGSLKLADNNKFSDL